MSEEVAITPAPGHYDIDKNILDKVKGGKSIQNRVRKKQELHKFLLIIVTAVLSPSFQYSRSWNVSFGSDYYEKEEVPLYASSREDQQRKEQNLCNGH